MGNPSLHFESVFRLWKIYHLAFVNVSVIFAKIVGSLTCLDLGLAYFFLCFTQTLMSSSFDAVGFFDITYYLIISYYQTSLAVMHKMISK